MNHLDIQPLATNTRIQNIVIGKIAIDAFRQKAMEMWDLQAVEYKPFLRFAVADLLDEIEINPLLCCPDRAVAADALLKQDMP